MAEYIVYYSVEDTDELMPYKRERIVRCKDCTKFSDGKRGIGYCQEFASDGKKAVVQRSGFCAWGEPREYTGPTITDETEGNPQP